MNSEPVHLLVFSPHPSDPDFGIGGTVARWTREKKDVVYVICTNGDKGTSDPELLPGKLAETREKEQLEAAAILGVKKVVFLDHPDLGLENVAGLKKEILSLILHYRPTVVATCDPYYPPYISNSDHRVAGRAVLDAVWPMAQAPNTYRDLLAEGLKLHRVKEVMLWQAAQPNYCIDISDTYETKMAACRCHQSQIGPPGNPEFYDQLVEIARTAGKSENYQWGESFYRMEVLQRL
ncbi:MAG: PIG-L family deacetylase [Dehalococcoidales bacterium]|nr:PIG-L family deacetylase [Dehalococcoidales bacterium]